MKLLVFLGICLCVSQLQWHGTEAAKIIMFSVFGSQSHLNMFHQTADALAERGHEVTLVGSGDFKPSNSKKFKQYFIKDIFEKMGIDKSMMGASVMGAVSGSDKGGSWTFLFKDFPTFCKPVLEDEIIEKLLKEGKVYDVAINNAFMNECTMPVSATIAKYLVQLSSAGLTSLMAHELNVPFPYATIPNILLSHSTDMNFKERAINALSHIGLYALTNMYNYPITNGIVQAKYPNLPSVQEAKKKTSLLLINRISSVDGSIPSLPYVQEIGGINNEPAKELPKDIKDFIEGSGDAGIIYIALGSVVPEEFLPEEKKRMFIEAFSKIPQRVVWKFKEKRTDLPPNVKAISWAPQQDILGHPKCKAFISHGGHLSLDESLYHGVPVIGMPIFGDQPANVAHLAQEGWGIELLWKDLTVDTLVQKLKEITTNPRYKEKTAILSKRMRDQPQTAKERAVYWIEYVMRHDGAMHLRTAADNLNFFQYFLLDVIGAALLVLFVTLYVTYKVLQFVFCKLCCGKKNKKGDKTKKNN